MTGMPTTAPPPEAPPPRRRRRWFWRFLLYSVVLLLLLACAGALGAYLVYDHVTRPGLAGEKVRFTVPEGASGMQVAKLLADSGLVDDAIFIRVAMHLDKRPLVVKAGTYNLARGLSPMQILDKLREGPSKAFAAGDIPDELKVTVPEGLSIAQASALFANPQAYVDAASDPVLIGEIGVTASNLEGFLLPSTYFFDKKPTERDVVERMVKEFKKTYAKLLEEMPDAASRDLLETITVASLVEEEARVDDERPLVAAVVYNRLETKMLLGMDSTLQFALNKYGQRLLDKDKGVDSPYNTYVHTGLPPGPICSPGLASIRAAMRPSDETYLYFVSNADGKTHTFTKTLDEHNRAVAKFRREIAAQRRELKEEQKAGQ